MKLKEMLSLLIPTLYKRDLTDTIVNALKELKETNLVVYQDADQQFTGYDFHSTEIKRLLPTFNVRVKKRPGNIITTTHFALNNLVEMIEKIRPTVERNFQDANIASAITYKKAQYLQLIDAIKFYIKYTREFLDYLIIAETAKFDPGNTISKRLNKAQIQQVENGFNSFCLLTGVFVQDIPQVMRLLEEVPDVLIVPENIEVVESTLGTNKVDPLRLNMFYDVKRNPFYMKQMRQALKDHLEYEKALEERELIRLRLIYLRRQVEDGGESQDPSLSKQIEYLEGQVQVLQYKIEKSEKAYQ